MRSLPALLALFLAASAPSTARASTQAAFDAWLERYRHAATARGIDPAWMAAALEGLSYNPRVVALDRMQPDDPARQPVFATYLARRLTPDRIAAGQRERDRWQSFLRSAEARWGVPGPILLGIWGMESNYGATTGTFDVVTAVASLAFDGRREALFTRELDAALRILGEGRARRQQLTGSWAGAMGQPQFLPTSYLAHAVDGDGDGRADIWNSVPDTLHSIGAYLRAAGWEPGLPWGLRVAPPPGFDRESVRNPVAPTECIRPLERHSRFLPAAAWRQQGFQALGAPWPADEVELSLVEPDGPGGDAFLATRNYRALLAYNCSNFYALSVALLGDALHP
ncbi:lytic murein transglycosylase [Thermaurantiacus sp.]